MSPSTTPATWNEDGCLQVPRLPRQQPRRPGATPKTKRATRASPVPQVPRLPRQSRSRCHQVPRLPRETKMDVSKCHACRANSCGVPAPHLKPSAPPEPAQCHKCHTCHARVSCVTTSCVWARGVMTSCVWASCVWASGARAPRLPRETKMDVSKCHACRANSRGVPAPHLKPSAPPEPA